MTSDLEKSFKAKLRAIAKEKIVILQILVRLAKSVYHEHFVLKGGILLSKYIEIGRQTTDLDFLARKIRNEVSELKILFEKIANIDLQDGFLFREIKANELTHLHMGYPGVEVVIMAYFGETRFKEFLCFRLFPQSFFLYFQHSRNRPRLTREAPCLLNVLVPLKK